MKHFTRIILIAIPIFMLVFKAESQINCSRLTGKGVMSCAGDFGLAYSADVGNPCGIAKDSYGNIYIVNATCRTIRKIDTAGIVTIFAGDGTTGYSGDGLAANLAAIGIPEALAIDKMDNLYVSDQLNHVIRKVNLATGIISTFAGNGTTGYSGDLGMATSAQIDNVRGIAIDNALNVYLADANQQVIRKIDNSGIITTIAGTGAFGFSGDSSLATTAQFNSPTGIAIDNFGDLYVADYGNHRVRKIDLGTGIITTYVGDGGGGWIGEGVLASTASRSTPFGICFDSLNNLYVTSGLYTGVSKIDNSQIITTLSFNTFVDPYASAIFNPLFITCDANGTLYMSESNVHFVIQADQNLTSVTTNQEENNSINIYPNPSNDFFTIENKNTESYRIFIYDAIGNLVLSDFSTSSIKQIDINFLTAGMHMINIIDENDMQKTIKLQVAK